MMHELFDQEWLLTNGLGGYASSSVSSANTRHYHGLLISAFKPPSDRKLLVAKVEERVFMNGQYSDLSTNQYPNIIYPDGARYIQKFMTKPLPIWNYGTEEWQLEKRITMVQGSNTTLLQYTNTGRASFTLEMHPLYAYTDYHNTFHENPTFDFYTIFAPDHLKTYPLYGSPPLFTSWTAGNFLEARDWYRNVQLPKSQERGLHSDCDYYRIGYLKIQLKPNQQIILCFTVDGDMVSKDLKKLWALEYNKASIQSKGPKSIFYNDLLRSGNQFLVSRESTKSKSIIAGYHWFADWGRDTMISMRGLTIATGRKAISKSILSTFFGSIDLGMIPDRFPDNGNDTVAYNSMDATLWLFIATYEYYHKFGDTVFIKKRMKALKEILEHHVTGTRCHIHVTDEGLLFGGQEGEQLTWMDAMVNGKVITPRMGCPVEINALWYNALRIYQFFCKELQSPYDKKYDGLISKFETNFPKMFLNKQGTLYDVIVPNGSNGNSFRPNQLFCLSLPFRLLNPQQEKCIFEAIKSKLYTPFGLRTLAMDDPNFIGSYQGDQWSRDHAYHQGTVWPFLLYDYFHSFFRIYGKSHKNKKKVLAELTDLKVHFYDHNGLYCISEIFDGLKPNQGKGKGCIQQAWSVSALIKLYTDYELYKLDGDQTS
ncbi:MAG: amylo-alpha-1,6-glucosidase [Maribacter sp.]|nr:amylo-alpha-1,6-glucosidase [Maribacter sp.]